MYFQKSSACIVGNMVSEGTAVLSVVATCCTNFAKDPDGGAFLSLRSTLMEESAADKLGRLAGGCCSCCCDREFLIAIPLRFKVGLFCAGAADDGLVDGGGGFRLAVALSLLLALVEAVELDVAAALFDGAPPSPPFFFTRPMSDEAFPAGGDLDDDGAGGGGGGGRLASPKAPGLSFAANFF